MTPTERGYETVPAETGLSDEEPNPERLDEIPRRDTHRSTNVPLHRAEGNYSAVLLEGEEQELTMM
jgi:hypothetical protein